MKHNDAMLRNLENESLLLLYLADELPAEDRQELETLLDTDGGLRSQLKSIREAQGFTMSSLAHLDAVEPLRSPGSSVRNVSLAIQQWRIDQLNRPQAEPARPSRMPFWIYAGSSAAAALIVFCIWWGFRPEPVMARKELVPASNPAFFEPQPDDSTNLATNVENGSSPDQSHHDVPVILSMDVPSQRLGDLEQAVSEDLR